MSYQGADYRKADLQLHSPRDANWGGDRPDGKLSATASTEEINKIRRSWAKEFVDNCVVKGIQVAALTDHHEGIYCWHVLTEVEERTGKDGFDFWFMPGMELTCKDSAQAIILFDAAISKALFEKARNILKLPTETNEYKQQGITVELLAHNVHELQHLLEADDELRNRFIILPNVTPGGHKTVLRPGFHKRFKELPYVGGYLDKVYPDDLNAGDRRILDGEIPAWSSEKRGVISTSDARSSDFKQVGEFATWLKMTVPTAESLRQAMLAAGSRILYKQPAELELYIESVTVTGAEFLHLDQPIHLSAQFSAIIGGRGSGKSTLLEYIRYALGISALDLEGSKWDPTYVRRKELLTSTLKASQVQVSLIKEGVSISLLRTTEAPDRIMMQVGAHKQPLSLDDARSMFPVQAYSQGELSHLGDETAETRLFELVTASHRELLEAVESDIQITSSMLLKHLAQSVELWRMESEQRKIDAQLLTITAGIEKVKAGLVGLAPETQAILDQHQEVANTARWFKQINVSYKESYDALAGAFEQHLHLPENHLVPVQIPTAGPAQELALALRTHIDSATDAYLSLVTANQDFERQRVAAERAWSESQAQHSAKYAEAVEHSKQYTESLTRLEQLERQLATELQKREALTKRMAPLLAMPLEITKQGGSYISHQHELRRLSSASANQLATLTNDQARAELATTDDTSELEKTLNALFQGSGVRTNRIEELLRTINAHNTLDNWWALIDELLAVLRWKITGLHETEQRPPLPMLEQAIDKGGLQKFCDQLAIDRVGNILTAVVRPRIHLLQKRGSTEIAFSQASQGEKATILLNVLMRQPGGPLILDQPEEDLDNRIIGEIVTATHDAKTRKQLIFATHNANLVVNGDAELVVDLINGRINQLGAIDLEPLCESITETMEGGKEAFELRRRKYNF